MSLFLGAPAPLTAISPPPLGAQGADVAQVKAPKLYHRTHALLMVFNPETSSRSMTINGDYLLDG